MDRAPLAKELKPVFEQKIETKQCFGSLDFYQLIDYAHIQYESASDHYESLSSCPLIAAADDIAHWYAEMELLWVDKEGRGPSAEDRADRAITELLEQLPRFVARGRS